MLPITIRRSVCGLLNKQREEHVSTVIAHYFVDGKDLHLEKHVKCVKAETYRNLK